MEAEENLFLMQLHAPERSSHTRSSLCVKKTKSISFDALIRNVVIQAMENAIPSQNNWH